MENKPVSAQENTALETAAPKKKKSKAFLYWLIPLCIVLPFVVLAAVSVVNAVNTANSLYSAGDFKEARSYYERVEPYISYGEEMIDDCNYRIALEHLEKGRSRKAYEMFTELGSYKDSTDKAKEARYMMGEELLKEKDYTAAQAIFEELRGFRNADGYAADCEINQAIEYYREGDLDKCSDITRRYYLTNETARVYDILCRAAEYNKKGIDYPTASQLYLELSEYQYFNEDTREAMEFAVFFPVRMFDTVWLYEEGEYYVEYNVEENCLYNYLPWETPEGELYFINDDTSLYFFMENEAGEITTWFTITGFNEYLSLHPEAMYVADGDGNKYLFHNGSRQ